jgi:hypothetical protein
MGKREGERPLEGGMLGGRDDGRNRRCRMVNGSVEIGSQESDFNLAGM